MAATPRWTAEHTARWRSSLPGHGWRRGRDIDIATLTLALAAQLVLCAAPLLVAGSAVARRLNGRSVGSVISHYLGLEGQAADDVTSLFTSSTHVSMTELVGGLIVGVLFGTGVAVTQQRAYETLWSLPRAGLRAVWRQLTWVLGLLAYLFVVLHAGRIGHDNAGRLHSGIAMRTVSQFVVSLLFYWWSQWLLLCGRVSWRRLLPGAACMSFAMTVLVLVSAIVLPGQITEEVSDYGLVGATFVLSVWLVFLSAVILGGALVGAVIVDRQAARRDAHRELLESAQPASDALAAPAEQPDQAPV